MSVSSGNPQATKGLPPIIRSRLKVLSALGSSLLSLTLVSLAIPAIAAAQPSPQEVQAYESQANVNQETAESRLAVQERGVAIVRQLTSLEGSAFAGVWFDNSKGEFVVPLLPSVDRTVIETSLTDAGLAGDFRLEPVRYSWKELGRGQERIGRALRSPIGEGFAATSIDPSANAVVIYQTEGASGATRENIRSLAQEASVRVSVRLEPIERFQTEATACRAPYISEEYRRSCDKPLRGGVFWQGELTENLGYMDCTTGFKATAGGNTYFLTAGHCTIHPDAPNGNQATYWRALNAAGEAHYVGYVEQRAYPADGGEHDAAKIRVQHMVQWPNGTWHENWWEEGVTSWPIELVAWSTAETETPAFENVPIEYESSSFMGETVCHSGYRSGSSCGEVNQVDKEGNVDGYTVRNMTEVRGSGLIVISGDSGGSVWKSGTHTALGMVSTGGSGYMNYTEITEDDSVLGVTVGTPAGDKPYAKTEPPSGTEGRQATFKGTVDPNGLQTSYYFEYGIGAEGYTNSTQSWGAGTSWGPVAVAQVVSNLRPNAYYHYRIVATNSMGTSVGGGEYFSTPTAAPLATTEGYSNIHASEGMGRATVTGTVEPGGLPTTYQFQWGTTTNYGNWTPSPGKYVGSGSENIQVSTELSGLKGSTTYHYQLLATNEKGTTPGGDREFSTPAWIAQVTTEAASEVKAHSATLHGTVNPEGFATEAHFEYDTKEYKEGEGAHGTSVPSPEISVGSGTSGSPISTAVSALAIGTTYHYRAVAHNSNGTQYGKDKSFQTPNKPAVISEPPTPLSSWETKLKGTVNPERADTHYFFEYDTNEYKTGEAAHGTKVPATPEDIGSSNFTLPVHQTLSGLEETQTYYFRLIAENEAGTSEGTPRSFRVPVLPKFAAPNPSVSFTGEGGRILLNSTRIGTPASIECEHSKSSGKLAAGTGNAEGVSLEFYGKCIWSFGGIKETCGEPLKTHTLSGSLGFTGDEEAGPLGLKLRGEFGEFINYECMSTNNAFSGSVVGEIPEVNASGENQYDKPRVEFEVLFSASGITQSVQTLLSAAGYESGLHLSATGLFGGESSLTMVETLKTAEAVELKLRPTFGFAVGGSGSGPGQLSHPAALASDKEGNVWVADTSHNRVQEFNPKGEFVRQLGAYGSENGEFKYPEAIAVNRSSGNVYVADTQNNRIQEFNSSGEFIRKWGSSGAGNGQFSYPGGVAIDSSGNVWVTDTGNKRIEEFTSEGAYLTQFGKEGTEAAQFKSPRGIAVDGLGNVWVADTNNNRVQELKPSGEFIRTFGWGVSDGEAKLETCTSACRAGLEGSGTGQLAKPYGLAFDPEGKLWVSDTGNDRIERFSTEGTYLAQFGAPGDNNGQFAEPEGLASDPSGNIWIADTANNRIQESTPTEFERQAGGEGSGPGQLASPAGIATDKEGNAWVADTAHNRVQEFNPKGEFIRQFGAKGTANGEFSEPAAIAVNKTTGNVYVADTHNNRVQEFNSSGAFIRKWGPEGTGNGQFSYPRGIAVDSEGHVWVTDTNNGRMQEFSAEGTYITQFGKYGTENGQFKEPQGVATDSAGIVWVADTGNNRVQELKANGEFIRSFGTKGTENGQFNAPKGIAFDPEGKLWVTDTANNRLQRFSATGEYLSQLGAAGNNNGQLSEPQGLATDSAGNVWVADTRNNRIEEFTPTEFIRKFGGEGSGAGQLSSPAGVATDSSGNAWVADTSHNRVQEFNSKGEFVRQFGAYGSSNGLFSEPKGIAVNKSSGNVYVADAGHSRIEEFNSKGEFIRTWGSSGSGNGQFEGLSGLALDPEGHVWTVEVGGAGIYKPRVQEFSAEGSYIGQFGGSEGSENGQLKWPQGIATDAAGNVWVADTNNNRVQEFKPSGEFIRAFGSLGSGEGQLSGPRGVAIDGQGKVWVSDTGNDRIEIFSSTGTYLEGFGAPGDNNGQFSEPKGLAIDSSTDIWIADTANNRVQKWRDN